MIVTVYTTDGGSLDIHNFDAQTVLELIAEIQEAEPDFFLTFDLDDGGAQVFVQKRHVVRIDVDHDPRTLRDRMVVQIERWFERNQRRAEARRGNLRVVPPPRVHPTREDLPPEDYEG